VSTADPCLAPNADDLRGLGRGLYQVVDLARKTLSDEAGPSAAGRRVMAHLGCELADVIPVTERFPLWEHVNVQRGVDAYLAAYGSGEAWFGLPGGYHRPHENMLSTLNYADESRVGAAGYGTAPVGPDENTEVVVHAHDALRPPVLRGQHFAEVLAEMGGEHNALTRSLLGAPAGSAPGGPPAADREPVQHPRPWPVHPRG